MTSIIIGFEDYRGYFSGENNFRYYLYPQYKANRTQPRPSSLQAVKDYLTEQWGFTYADGVEADDALAMDAEALKFKEEVEIVSIDKDLKQIPGRHYNFVTGEEFFIDEFQGLYNFYKQLLTGDTADNIPGVRGIGPKKAERILAGCDTEEELFNAVRETYNDDETMLLYGQLLWLLREPGKVWTFPTFEQAQEQRSESIHSQEEEKHLFMEHGGAMMNNDGLLNNGDETDKY